MIEYLIFYSINQQQQQNKIKMAVAKLNDDILEDLDNTCAIMWEEEYDNDDYDGLFTEDDQIWWRMRDHVCDELYTEEYEEDTLLWRLEDMPMKQYAEIERYWRKHLSPNKNQINFGDPNGMNTQHLFEYMMTCPETIVLKVVIDLVPDICVQLADRIIEDRNVVRKKIFCEVSKLPCVVNELICEYVAE